MSLPSPEHRRRLRTHVFIAAAFEQCLMSKSIIHAGERGEGSQLSMLPLNEPQWHSGKIKGTLPMVAYREELHGSLLNNDSLSHVLSECITTALWREPRFGSVTVLSWTPLSLRLRDDTFSSFSSPSLQTLCLYLLSYFSVVSLARHLLISLIKR